MDAVIVTINNLEGESPQNYADNYYDYNGYGLGNEESGLILLIDKGLCCCRERQQKHNKRGIPRTQDQHRIHDTRFR